MREQLTRILSRIQEALRERYQGDQRTQLCRELLRIVNILTRMADKPTEGATDPTPLLEVLGADLRRMKDEKTTEAAR
jgi:hypothetical protein